MRTQTIVTFLLAPLLIAWANKGTIIDKIGRPLPFAYSCGIDATYKFALRDRLGQVRWQLVSSEVFHCYQVGDYFNDESPMPILRACCAKDGKEIALFCPNETIPIQVPRFQPIPLEPGAVRR